MTAMLERLGVRPLTAADLGEALETLQDEGPCGLVLLATLVSARDTCDTIQAIFSHQGERQIPVVVMGNPEDQAQLAACGPPGTWHFLPKPVAPAALEALLERLLPGSPGSGADGGA